MFPPTRQSCSAPRTGLGAFGRNTYSVLVLVQVNKASCFEPFVLNLVLEDSKGATHLLAALHENLAPLTHGISLFDGVVVAFHIGRGLHALNDAAGLQATIGLFEQGVPVCNAPAQEADVHVIQRLGRKRPLARAIVDLARRWLARRTSTRGLGRYEGKIEM